MKKNIFITKENFDLKNLLQQYAEFIVEVDARLDYLNQLQHKHLNCKPGCSLCCKIDRTVNLIEGYWLNQHYQQLNIKDKTAIQNQLGDLNKCPLLINNKCMLYQNRPVLCRSHGLPLLYHDGLESGIGFCELNFLNGPIEFTDANILNMDAVNAKLMHIDQVWAEKVLNVQWNAQRIYIRDILT